MNNLSPDDDDLLLDWNNDASFDEESAREHSLRRSIYIVEDDEDGNTYTADEILDDVPQDILFNMRATLTAAYKSGVNKYVCKACQQPLGLKIRTAEGGFFPFFSHYQKSDPCPLKTQIEVDPSTSVRTMINNFESSAAFQNMLNRLTEVLKLCESFTDVEIRKLISTPEVKGYRRPALYSHFQQDKTVCFDLLISNPMLGLLVGRNAFYKMQKFFYLWLFPSFNTDHQGISQKDILYMNRRNVFVFDSEDNYNDRDGLFTSKYSIPQYHKCAYEESIKQKRLMVNCYWQSPKITDVRGNKKISIQWNGPVLVPFDELCFDRTTNELYYHDSDIDFYQTYPEETQQLIDEWIRIKNDRWNRIYDGIERRKNLYMQMMKRKERKDQLAYLYSLIENEDVVPEVYQDPESQLYGYNINGLNWIPAIYYKAKPFNYGYAWVRKKERWGVIDIKNNRVTNFDYTSIESLNDKYYVGEKRKKSVLLDFKGCILGSYEGYDFIQPFSEELFLVADKHINRDHYGNLAIKPKWGIVNSSGLEKQPCIFTSIEKKGVECIIVRYEDKIGYIDNKGNTLIPCKFNEIKEFVNGIADARIDQRWSQIDERGNEIYDYTPIDENNSFYYSKFYDLYGIMNSSNQLLTSLLYREIKVLSNGYSIVKETNQSIYVPGWQLVDKNGHKVLETVYDEIIECPSGKLKLRRNSKWGLADYNRLLFPCEFDGLKDWDDGKIDARLGMEWSQVDESGQEIFEYKQADNEHLIYYSRFNHKYGLMTSSHEDVTGLVYSDVKVLFNQSALAVRKDLWGIIANNGNVILPQEYEAIIDCLDGMFKIQKGNKWGCLNSDFITVLPCVYDELKVFSNGIIKARLGLYWSEVDENNKEIFVYNQLDDEHLSYYSRFNQKYGIMTSSHQDITGSIYTEINPILDRTAIAVRTDKWGVIAMNGDPILPCEYETICFCQDGKIKVQKADKWGFLNSDFATLLPCEYDELKSYSNGKVEARIGLLWSEIDETGQEIFEYKPMGEDHIFYYSRFEGKYGIMTSTYQELTGLVYTKVKPILNGTAFALMEDKWGVKTNSAETILPCEYDEIIDCLDGKLKVRKNLHWGYVNSQGGTILPCEYDEVKKFENGKAQVRIWWRWSEVDETGKELFEYKPMDADHILYYSRLKDKYGIMTSAYKELTGLIYSEMKYILNGTAIAVKNEDWGVLANNGETILPCEYDEIIDCLNGKLKVRKGYWGYVNGDGTTILPCIFEDLKDFSDGKVKALKDSRWSEVDENGNEIYLYDQLDDEHISFYSRFRLQYGIMTNSHQIVTDLIYTKFVKSGEENYMVLNGCWGLINASGKQIIPCQYDSLFLTSNNMYIGKLKGLFGLLSSKGEIVVPFVYNQMKEIALNRFSICKDYLFGVIDNNNQIIVPIIYKAIGKYYGGSLLSVKDDDVWIKVPFSDRRQTMSSKEKFTKGIDLSKLDSFKIYEAITTGYKDYGVFINIPGIGAGLIPIRELNYQHRQLSEFESKQIVKVVVLGIDKQKNRATFTFAE